MLSLAGFLKNTRPLKYDESHSYVLSIVANDCGGKKSAPILVIVEVKQPCKTGWNGLSSQINYVPSTGPQPLFPHATLNLCPEDTCAPKKLESTLYLETRHVGKGCDRDTYTLASQRRLCGANEEAVELLPEEAKNMRDEAKESDKSITRFDGKTGFDITDTTDVLDVFPGSVFTLATWMKHEEQDVTDKHHKEHIICTADDHSKNLNELNVEPISLSSLTFQRRTATTWRSS